MKSLLFESMEPTKRLHALDIFRGITITGMILVNNPGDWGHVYSPLLHAEWHGCTPTDLVFPFFLFILGVAIPFSLGAKKQNGVAGLGLYWKVGKRALIIFGFGLLLAAMPKFGIPSDQLLNLRAIVHYVFLGLFFGAIFLKEIFRDNSSYSTFRNIAVVAAISMIIIGIGFYDFSKLRIPGVLQRIGIVYGITALLFLKTGWKAQLYIGLGLLLAYWGLMTLVPVPDGYPPNLEPETNLGAWLDRTVLGNHLWSQSKVWDPEGLLSTMPAIVTGICGVLTGIWLKSDRKPLDQVVRLLAAGVLLVCIGLVWDLAFPINKKIWTSSYVVYTGGIAMMILSILLWITDILNWAKPFKPFSIYGMNALVAFIASGIVAKMLYTINWTTAEGKAQTLGSWIYNNIFLSNLSDYNASLAYAITNVGLIFLLCWWLFANKKFIRV